LRQFAKVQKQARMRIRLQAIVLAREGRTAPQIAAALGAARRAVQEWVARYNRNGIGGLSEGPAPVSRRNLPGTAKNSSRRVWMPGALSTDGVCTLRAADVKRILENEFNVVYSLKGVYKLLHRLVYSCLAPRPRHKLADASAQDAFKKVLWMSSSRCEWLTLPSE
jgi:transposase